MTETCLPVVNWLKSWFKAKDEDYFYDMTVSDYNPRAGSTITVNVFVTDGNNNIVRNHSFTLWVNDDTRVTLTTDGEGVASYTYTCSQYGLCRFSIESYSTFINIKEPIVDSGWKEVTYSSGYDRYATNNGLYYRRVGNYVEVSGVWTSTATRTSTNDAVTFATIPSEYAPSRVVRMVCQGSAQNKYLLTIQKNGELQWSRYGTNSLANLPNTVWGTVHAFYLL